MNAPALPLTIGFVGDASLGAVLDALRPHAARRLVISYDGRQTEPGYHVTEVKAGSFVTLDCGGNPDAWQETILQVEDLPASAEKPDHMEVGRFLAILEKVAARGDFRELVVRAALLRARLGEPEGMEPARLLAEAIDNPALHAGLAAAA